jgi:hypothetical protein
MLAVMSFVVSCLAAGYAYVQAKATKAQARYAEVDAGEAIRSARTTELALIHEAQKQFEERAPHIIIGIEQSPPSFVAYDYEQNLLSEKKYFSRLNDSLCSIEATVKGILLNESDRSIVVGGAKLFGGNSPLWKEAIPSPVKFDEMGFYLIGPDQAALFEWRAGNTVADWYDFLKQGRSLEEDTVPCMPYMEFLFRFASDYSGERHKRIEIKLERAPCYIANEDNDRLVLMDIKPGVYVSRTEAPPKSMDQLRRKMRAPE